MIHCNTFGTSDPFWMSGCRIDLFQWVRSIGFGNISWIHVGFLKGRRTGTPPKRNSRHSILKNRVCELQRSPCRCTSRWDDVRTLWYRSQRVTSQNAMELSFHASESFRIRKVRQEDPNGSVSIHGIRSPPPLRYH